MNKDYFFAFDYESVHFFLLRFDYLQCVPLRFFVVVNLQYLHYFVFSCVFI
jgi:hypothetical protein